MNKFMTYFEYATTTYPYGKPFTATEKPKVWVSAFPDDILKFKRGTETERKGIAILDCTKKASGWRIVVRGWFQLSSFFFYFYYKWLTCLYGLATILNS
jgi:hypothetical protein